ncbi:uncharacterized protein ARMOST_14364 [Armillaria ostoyae]|uniref:Uncharacterized protein n=1 Tax=Armillaria ostoyae TaxID=47428 RepID=A0A284RQF7_ARMOS|nr:uncharacterized protein ARMOST_14364 [Armillaria ostoyae]
MTGPGDNSQRSLGLIGLSSATTPSTVEPCSISSKQSWNHQLLALCEISPVVPCIVRSLKLVSSGKEAQLTTLPRYHIRGHLDNLWQIDFLAFTSLPLEDITFPTTMSFRQWLRLRSYPFLKSLIAVEMHNFAAFGAYTVARGPPLENLSLPYANFNVYSMFLESVAREANHFTCARSLGSLEIKG